MLLVVAVIAGYMLLLVGLAVASPGIGFTGSLLHLVPGDWRDAAHVPAYGLLAWLAMVGLPPAWLAYSLRPARWNRVCRGLWLMDGGGPGDGPGTRSLPLTIS
jgi:hypothetical protein